jgi:hypothetical protein
LVRRMRALQVAEKVSAPDRKAIPQGLKPSCCGFLRPD